MRENNLLYPCPSRIRRNCSNRIEPGSGFDRKSGEKKMVGVRYAGNMLFSRPAQDCGPKTGFTVPARENPVQSALCSPPFPKNKRSGQKSAPIFFRSGIADFCPRPKFSGDESRIFIRTGFFPENDRGFLSAVIFFRSKVADFYPRSFFFRRNLADFCPRPKFSGKTPRTFVRGFRPELHHSGNQ